MPTLTRWFLRAAMLHLVVALLLGVLMAAPPSWTGPLPGAAFPAYIHLLVMGWATQMIFGVAYWMFPRPSSDHGHGSSALGWVCFGALNTGLLLRAVAEPAGAIRPSRLAAVGLLLAALLLLIAVLAFTALTWRRVAAR